MSDGELVRQSLAGEDWAYAQLVGRWSPRILAVCRARVHRLDIAEELAQETLVRAWRALDSLSDAEKFGHWLCGIATRVCLDWLKNKQRTEVTLDAAAADGESTFACQQVEHGTEDELNWLKREVRNLPEKHREAIMLYYSGEHTYEELGQMLGVSAATINARLTQARQMLRQRAAAREV